MDKVMQGEWKCTIRELLLSGLAEMAFEEGAMAMLEEVGAMLQHLGKGEVGHLLLIGLLLLLLQVGLQTRLSQNMPH